MKYLITLIALVSSSCASAPTLSQLEIKMGILRGKMEVNDDRGRIVLIDNGIDESQRLSAMTCRDSSHRIMAFANPLAGSVATQDGSHGADSYEAIARRMDFTKYCIVFIRIFAVDGDYHDALKLTLHIPNIVAVNLSLSSYTNLPENRYETEVVVLRKLTDKGIRVQVATGNDSMELSEDNCNVYPACLGYELNENFSVVKAQGAEYNNTFRDLHVVPWYTFKLGNGPNGLSGGSSLATARYTGFLFSK